MTSVRKPKRISLLNDSDPLYLYADYLNFINIKFNQQKPFIFLLLVSVQPYYDNSIRMRFT